MQDTNLLTIFLTGLFTGGLTCLAVQGGLLATAIAQRKEGAEVRKTDKLLPLSVFLLAKLLAYVIFGLLLGWLGSVVTLSLTVRMWLQILISLFMIGTAFSLLELHPFFRYFIIQPPRFLTKMLRNQSKSADIFTPALLGLMTIFIPCGTTQAMMALAIGTGSGLAGALIMFAFILGTIPLFFILGYSATTFSAKWQKNFYRLASIGIIILALYNMLGAISLSGATWLPTKANNTALVQNSQKEITILITNSGYQPNTLDIKAGEEITLTIKNENAYSCAQAFTIPKFGIEKVVAPGTEEVIKFTAPSDLDKIAFTCSMGMYRGVFNIVK